jgi:hypothetical protein
MALEFTTSYLQDALSPFRYYKKPAGGAMAQVDDEHLFAAPGGNARHTAGNIRSRWTGFVIADGEKPWDRHRGFVAPEDGRAALTDGWESAVRRTP